MAPKCAKSLSTLPFSLLSLYRLDIFNEVPRALFQSFHAFSKVRLL